MVRMFVIPLPFKTMWLKLALTAIPRESLSFAWIKSRALTSLQ